MTFVGATVGTTEVAVVVATVDGGVVCVVGVDVVV